MRGCETLVGPEVKLRAGDPFDDQHGSRANGTTHQVRCFGAICGGGCAKQLAAACEGGLPSSIGEEAEMADADQTLRQDVKKKSAQELICRNGHDLLLAAVSIVPPAEGDAMVLKGHETMVGDGDAMGVAGQVVGDMFGTANGGLA